ncbi:hypothetical protein BJ138DRAFT_1174035 [Hygrophoropsis aurantiaca]|uniref:Uncharacterized protein n=1 Tax=Hygrophoropsis aurantiaca TaxID=72124 RepID=A0ACB8A6N5_9AGAM|nr:hypothetical protein BJ138DRAFT_1174035 [Hygrophoropsis aurantiaca]
MASPPISLSTVLYAIQHPRKPRLKYRTTFIALFGLISLSCYIFFVARPSLDLAPIQLRQDARHSEQQHPIAANVPDPDSRTPSSRLFKLPPTTHKKVPVHNKGPQITLSPEQELAAVSWFLGSLQQNTIPHSVDPSKPIDPQLVLDFDTHSARAADEVNQIMQEVWTRYPVMLFAKLHSANSREIRFMLANMNLRPSPTVFEIDQRQDAEILTPLLYRLTSSTELPIMLVGGKPVGSMAEMRRLHESGELQKMIADAGAVIDGAKKKKGKK